MRCMYIDSGIGRYVAALRNKNIGGDGSTIRKETFVLLYM